MASIPIYLTDSDDQTWQIGVTNAGLLISTAVSLTGPTFILINDTSLATTWMLQILTTGNLQVVAASSPTTAPYAYYITAPNGQTWTMRVNNGLLQTLFGGKNYLTGGNFQDAAGNPVAFGTLLLQLPQDAVASQPGLIASQIQLQIPLDANGNVAGNVAVWPTDQLTPSNLAYTATVLTNSNTQVWGPWKELILSSPSPFNLDVWTTPSNQGGGGGGGGVSSLDLEVDGTQNKVQTLLNLVSTNSVAFSDLGNGSVSAVANPSGAVLLNPSTDQAIVANNLLPIAGNLTQSLGLDAAPWNATLRNMNTIRFAEAFSGGDLGAKINAAFTDLAGTPGEVWVNQAAGLTLTTAVTVPAKSGIRFIQGGTYTYSAEFTMSQGSFIVGQPASINEDIIDLPNDNPAVTLILATSSTLAVSINITGDNVVLQDFALNGVNANRAGTSVGVVTTAGRTRMFRCTIEGFSGDNVQVTSTGTSAQAIGPSITQCSLSRSESGNGITLTNTPNCHISECRIELNGVYGIRIINSQGTLIFDNDISTAGTAGIYATGTSSAGVLNGGNDQIVNNAIASPSNTSGLSSTTGGGIVINGWDAVNSVGNLVGGEIIMGNIVNGGTAGLEANTVDGIHIQDSTSNIVLGNVILPGASGYRYGIGIFSVNVTEGVDSVCENFVNITPGTGAISVVGNTYLQGNNELGAQGSRLVNAIFSAATPTGALTGLALGTTTATTATSGAATLPGNPVGFLEINLSGTVRKLPYYAT